MAMKTIISMTTLAFMAAGPTWAGQPEYPGRLGETIVSTNEALRELGFNRGQSMKETRENYDEYLPPGQVLQGIMVPIGASPNPCNDNGGGNDPELGCD